MLRKHRSMDGALDAIKREREYQNRLWGNAPSKGQHGIPAYILFMQNYLREAKILSVEWLLQDATKMLYILSGKSGLMAVACMEQNGIADRDMKDLDHSCKLHGVNCREDNG